ncbi:MAG: hypothetical protein J6B81_05080 [Spirochaetaceae bacterium]|nr:hypothetical protein [Spirochaetaceae bacterium]
MQKNKIFSIFLLLYETARLIAIVFTRPELSIEILPASWYAAIPLLALPLLLSFLMIQHEDTNTQNTCRNLYLICKVFSMLGLLIYFGDAIPFSLNYGQMNDYYSIKRSFFLMIFFLIDGILSVGVFLRGKKNNSTPEHINLTETPDQGENGLCK